MLTKLILKNFGKHTDLELVFKKYNLLCGPNAVGKSNILSAIDFFINFDSISSVESTKFINYLHPYAKIVGIFKTTEQIFKQEMFLQENQKINSKINVSLPIIYFAAHKNLLKDENEQERFLHLGTKQTFSNYFALFKELRLQKDHWKVFVNKQNYKTDAYELQNLKKLEAQISTLFYQVTKLHYQFVNLFNQELQVFWKKEFSELPFVVKVEFQSWRGCNINVSKAVFVKEAQSYLITIREVETTFSQNRFFSFALKFEAIKKRGFLSSTEIKIINLILRFVCGKLIEKQTQSGVLFLLDDFDAFDFDWQKKFFSTLQSFHQFIITTNKLQAVSPLFLNLKGLQTSKIKNNDERQNWR